MTVPLGHALQPVPPDADAMTCPRGQLVHRPPLAYWALEHAVVAFTHVANHSRLESGTLTVPDAHAMQDPPPLSVAFITWPHVHSPHRPAEVAAADDVQTCDAVTHVALTAMLESGTLTVPYGQYMQLPPPESDAFCTRPQPQALHAPVLAYCAEPQAAVALTQVAFASVAGAAGAATPEFTPAP